MQHYNRQLPMNDKQYLRIFRNAASELDQRALIKKELEVAVGKVLDSVYLKLYKKSWSNPMQDPLIADSRIFFSIWVNDKTLNEQRVFYNIHAFKLRHLKSYSIQSRTFADAFREKFKHHAGFWPNVSVNFGPLTLMEGWQKIDAENLQKDIAALANSFIGMEHIVDDTLRMFKKQDPANK